MKIETYVFVLFYFATSIDCHSKVVDFTPSPNDNISYQDSLMPIYPGCYTEECSYESLSQYIKDNILLPRSMRINNDHGITYAGITIDENGALNGGIKIHHPINQNASDQIYRLYGGLRNRGVWTPRKINNIPVSTNILIPIIFKSGFVSKEYIKEAKDQKPSPEGYEVVLEEVIIGGKKPSHQESSDNASEDDEIYKVVEVMPRFPGCEDLQMDNLNKKSCADKKLLEYIYTLLKYPEEARKLNIEGRVYVQFVVEKDGFLSNIKIVRDIGYGCGEASVKVVESMNELAEPWSPALSRGKRIRCLYTLPITFNL